jgi:integrase
MYLGFACDAPSILFQRPEELGHGWHALRRGLGTNLHDSGVQDKTIQAILRHSNVFVTQSYYIKTRQKAGVDAMKKLSAALLKLGKAA